MNNILEQLKKLYDNKKALKIYDMSKKISYKNNVSIFEALEHVIKSN